MTHTETTCEKMTDIKFPGNHTDYEDFFLTQVSKFLEVTP